MDKKKYEKVKTKVMELEEKNLSRLILFDSGKGWYKMGGNSLLIYYFKIAPLLNIKPNIQADTDYTKKIFNEGFISFRGTESLKGKLERLKLLKGEKEEDGFTNFELEFKVDPVQLRSFRADLRQQRENAVRTLVPEIVIEPVIYGKIRYLQKRTFEIGRKMNDYERKYNGLLISDYARKMAKYYLMMNFNLMEERVGWKKIQELTKLLLIEVVFLVDLRIIEQNAGVIVGEKIIEIQNDIENHLKRMKRNEC